jgi:putative ABC transport system permease protein
MNIIQNYFKVAIRNVMRQKMHSLINVLGLSTGMCFGLLIGAYVLFELSYDNFHAKGKRIFLLPMTWHFNGTVMPTGANCSVGGPFMQESFPEVEQTVRIKRSTLSLKKGNEMINESKVLYADSTFFNIFTFPLVNGNPAKLLSEPNSIVLTESMAVKYFGNDWASFDLPNQTLIGSNNKLYSITGVVKDAPLNSHIQFDFIVSLNTYLPASHQPNWDNSEFYTYLVLHPDANAQEVVKNIPARLESKFGSSAKEGVELDLVALSDIYLNNIKYKLPNTSDIVYVKIFIAIAFLILIVATLNYVNLSTARSMERALEVGVRKVMGAVRLQLFYQFMSESLIVTFFSLLIAMGLAFLSLPAFDFIIGKSLDLSAIFTITNCLLIAFGCLVVSLVAGLYPALVLSNYQPAKVLKGKLKDSVAGINLRRRLVILQFGISIILIVSALTVSDQLTFMRLKDSGYSRNQILSLSLDSLARTRVDVIKNKLLGSPIVASVSSATQLPVNITFETALNVKGSDERKLIRVAPVDADYLKTMSIAPIFGNDFSNSPLQDGSREIILNESAVSFFGWTNEEALGKELEVWQATGRVKGVVKDFHFSSLHSPIAPLVIFTGNGLMLSNLLVRVESGTKTDQINLLNEVWREVNPDSPFVLTHLDERYELLYQSEGMLSKIVNLFALLSALISGLGLFGLASYSILQRTKELGIRKVLGASVQQLVLMVGSSFIKQVVIALVLATPVSYFLMNRWLQGFNYKVDFNWGIVAAAGSIAILAAVATVLYHSLKAASNNPVDSLRSE